MLQVNRGTWKAEGNLRGGWSFYDTDGNSAIMIIRDAPTQGVSIGRAGSTNLFDVFDRFDGRSLTLGGTARGTIKDVSMDFYAMNGNRSPTYASISLGVEDGSWDAESGGLWFWTRNLGTLGVRGGFNSLGYFSVGNVNPEFSIDSSGDLRIRGTQRLRFGGVAGNDTLASVFAAGAGALKSDASIQVSRPSGAHVGLSSQIAGETGSRLSILARGDLVWSDGSSASDTSLYRASAQVLRTNSKLMADRGVSTSNVELGTGGPRWTANIGNPEGRVAAPVGSLYTRTDGGPGSTLYVKESGTGTTGWRAK